MSLPPLVRARAAAGARRGGFAMLAVLLVLLALFVLATPYLFGIRRADGESQRAFDRAAARLALDDAERWASSRLGATHPAVDETPYWDSEEELSVDVDLDPDFLDPSDPEGVMWDLESRDLSGLVDLESASPGVLANLIGASTWLSEAVAEDAASVAVASTRGFPAEGFLWIGGERLAYLRRGAGRFEGLARDVFPSPVGAAAVDTGCDASRARAHGAGEPVLGFAALALAEWRLASGTGELRPPSDLGDVARAFEESLAGPLDEVSFAALAATATPFGEAGAGPRWQRAVRLSEPVVGGVDCTLRVDDGHYFNPGTTVRVSSGRTAELALVRSVEDGFVRLQSILLHDYDTRDAVVEALARRPVNLNTAPPEVLHALFEGLKLARKNSRITEVEANRLVEAVLGARPFTGFQDFLERIVLPAAGVAKAESAPEGGSRGARLEPDGFLDPEDAEALYRNGLNANDAALAYSTMPFAFRSRGAFELSLRSAVNAKSGARRASLERDQVEVVVPQQELLWLWARQEDFDEELRLSREAPMWATGPESTSRDDGGTSPPSRYAAHLGTLAEGELEGELAPTFASREDTGWAQLQAVRLDDEQGPRHTRHVEHLDAESSDLEGRALARAGAFTAHTYDPEVEWSAKVGELLRPFSFSMWLEPTRRSLGALYFDLGDRRYPSGTDRISVTEEADAIVLQVLDPVGDHPETALREQGEVRVPIEHFPLDTWTHLSIDVRGSRPDQLTVFVDGMARGETAGLTRLTSNLGATGTTLTVESTRGFGAVGESCLVRIGDELIEAQVTGPQTLSASPNATGPKAGIGGRGAREREVWSTDGKSRLSTASAKDRSHPVGSTVELHGYSRPLRSLAPAGSSELANSLGPFAVAVVNAVVGGTDKRGDRIQVPGSQGPVSVGFGLEGQVSKATGLVLGRADDPKGGDTTFLSAFDERGGYALLVQEPIPIIADGSPASSTTSNGSQLGGMELIRYSGRKGNTLQLSGRGTPVRGELTRLAANPGGAGTDYRAFVSEYTASGTPDLNDTLDAQVFVLPISLPADGIFPQQQQFLESQQGITQYAQLTRLDTDRQLTEWIAYDEIAVPGSGGSPPQLVRDDPDVLERVYDLLTPGTYTFTVTSAPPSGGSGSGGVPLPGGTGELPPGAGGLPGGAGGGDGGGPAQGGEGGNFGGSKQGPGAGAGPGGTGGATDGGLLLSSAAFRAPTPATFTAAATTIAEAALAQDGGASAFGSAGSWTGELGSAEDGAYPLSRAVGSVLGFRGVMGTHSHAHPVGTKLLPVFRVWRREGDLGTPGAGDRAWLVDELPSAIGEPVVVHRAYLPDERYRTYTWSASGLVASAGTTGTQTYDEAVRTQNFGEQVFVALRDPIRIPLPPTGNPLAIGSTAGTGLYTREMREVARLVKYPSGELPRTVESISVGGDFQGPSSGRLPDAVVDELEFGATLFGQNLAGGAESGRGAALVLGQPVVQGTVTLNLVGRSLLDARGVFDTAVSPLARLPESGGLLRIGDEIVAYRSLDPGGGTISVDLDGRGMLGTDEQPHRAGEPITFLSHLRSTTLLASIGAGDADLPLADVAGFPERGTLLVGRELLHFTHGDTGGGTGLVGMPRASAEPGARDGEGGGLFRGRYGTAAAAHPADAPAVLFPTRYWDRWADRAEAPELSYFGFTASQEDAYWRTVFFEERESPHPGPRLGLLVRTDASVPWDEDPERARGLWSFDGTDEESVRLPVGTQSDRLEARVYVRYEPGAFDYDTGLAHGWKTTPELRFFGAELVAPRTSLYREER